MVIGARVLREVGNVVAAPSRRKPRVQQKPAPTVVDPENAAPCHADACGGVATRAQLRRRRTETAPPPLREAPAVRKSSSASTCKPEVQEPVAPREPEMMPVDRKHQRDEFFVSEYACDIFRAMKRNELAHAVAPGYMKGQAEVNEKMRSIMMDWLVEVTNKWGLGAEALFLTVNLVDRYLAKKPVGRKQLQLVGVTCLLIASKYEEIFPPEVQDFVSITDHTYTREQILQTEIEILNALAFQVTVPSPRAFLKRYLAVMGVEEDSPKAELAFFLLELTVLESAMLQFSPTRLACSALFLANRILCQGQRAPGQEVAREACWPAELAAYAGETDRTIRPCTKALIGALVGCRRSPLCAIYKKYSRRKHKVVLLPEVQEVLEQP